MLTIKDKVKIYKASDICISQKNALR